MYTKTVGFDTSVDVEKLPTHLARCLRDAKASEVNVNGGRIFFRAGLFRPVSNWNVLVPFGFGDLAIEAQSRQLRYRLSFRQLVLAATAVVALLSVFILFSRTWQALLFFVPVAWAWFVGANLATGLPRFHSFIRRCITTAPRVQGKGPV